HVPGLIRGWLTAEDRLPAEDRRSVDAGCARFWKRGYESHREDELQVTIDVELLACRMHALRAGLSAEFRWASVTLSKRLFRRAEWRAARGILDQFPEPERNGEIWYSLASIDLNEGKYVEAREKLTRALAMRQAIGDRAARPPPGTSWPR